MEKTDVSIEHEEHVPEGSKKMIDQETDDAPKKIEEMIGDKPIMENKTDDDEVVPSTTPKTTDEQENVTDTNVNLAASVSPGRANVPFKEVNESEKEENETPVNGAENINNKKRELDNDDEQIQEKILDNNDDRTGDQSKKMKINESTDMPVIDTKEVENNLVVNGGTTTEV